MKENLNRTQRRRGNPSRKMMKGNPNRKRQMKENPLRKLKMKRKTTEQTMKVRVTII